MFDKQCLIVWPGPYNFVCKANVKLDDFCCSLAATPRFAIWFSPLCRIAPYIDALYVSALRSRKTEIFKRCILASLTRVTEIRQQPFVKHCFNCSYRLTEPKFTILLQMDEYLPGYVAKAKYLWNYIFPTVHYYVNNAVTFISDNAPILIDNVSKSLSATIQWIYQLHPPFFDSAMMHASCAVNCLRRYLNDLWDLIVLYTPIVMEMSRRYLKMAIEILQNCFTTGQVWVQNMLR